MKKLLLSIAVASFGILSANSYADKIVVQGAPIVVQKEGTTYVVPSSTVVSDRYFFKVGDERRVCYKEVQPALSKVELGPMAFKLGNDRIIVHCYTYSPDYFVVP